MVDARVGVEAMEIQDVWGLEMVVLVDVEMELEMEMQMVWRWN